MITLFCLFYISAYCVLLFLCFPVDCFCPRALWTQNGFWCILELVSVLLLSFNYYSVVLCCEIVELYQAYSSGFQLYMLKAFDAHWSGVGFYPARCVSLLTHIVFAGFDLIPQFDYFLSKSGSFFLLFILLAKMCKWWHSNHFLLKSSALICWKFRMTQLPHWMDDGNMTGQNVDIAQVSLMLLISNFSSCYVTKFTMYLNQH